MRARVWFLVAVGALSLVLDRVSTWSGLLGSGWSIGARLFVLPLLVSLVLYLATGPDGSFRLPQRTWDRAFVPAKHRFWMVALPIGVPLIGGGLAVVLSGTGALVDAIGFFVTHPLAETLLFQGAVLQLATGTPAQAHPSAEMPLRPILIAAALQAVSQWQYIEPLGWAAIWLGLRVFLIAFVLCFLRLEWGSLWPVLAGYAINNGVAVYGGRPLGFHF